MVQSGCAGGVREGHERRGYGLEGEVCGEGVFLKGGELRAGEGTKGDDAANEGLEEGATEEGTVAADGVGLSL